MTRFLAIVLLVAGCAPSLPDGHFGCSDGICPSGYVCHHDKLCYADPQADYTLCDDAAECAAGVCNSDLLSSATLGLCAPTCGSDADCPASADGPSLCWNGHCRRACVVSSGAGDCPTGAGCVLVPGRGSTPACLYVDDVSLEGNVACTNATGAMMPCGSYRDCRVSPTGGSSGVCTLPCGPNAECPRTSECRVIPGTESSMATAQYICLKPCIMDADCAAPLVCKAAAAPPNAKFCAPSSWSTLPANP